MILPGRELNLPKMQLFNKHQNHFSTETLFVFRDHCRRGALVPVMRAIWVRDYGNRNLSELLDYRAHIGAVTVHLWRGAYSVHNIKIVKTSG